MVFLFFGSLHPLPNPVVHTWLKSQLHICNYEWANFFLLTRVLTQNLNTVELVNFLKNQKIHIQIIAVLLNMASCKTKRKKKEKEKESGKPRFFAQTNFFLSTLPFSLWADLATWLHVEVPQKIQEKWT